MQKDQIGWLIYRCPNHPTMVSMPPWPPHHCQHQLSKDLLTAITHQAIQLRDRALVAWMTDIPDLDTSFPTSVHMPCGVADCNCTDHFPVVQGVNLPSMTWDSWPNEGIRRKRYRLHLAICTYMKWVCPRERRREKNMFQWAARVVWTRQRVYIDAERLS